MADSYISLLPLPPILYKVKPPVTCTPAQAVLFAAHRQDLVKLALTLWELDPGQSKSTARIADIDADCITEKPGGGVGPFRRTPEEEIGADRLSKPIPRVLTTITDALQCLTPGIIVPMLSNQLHLHFPAGDELSPNEDVATIYICYCAPQP